MIPHANQNDLPEEDDRFFEAVRYLLDEMSAQEAQQFEDQLAEDQSLRELLAEAVLLTQTTYQAIVPPTVPTEPIEVASPYDAARWNGYVVGIVATLAASLLVAISLGIAEFMPGDAPEGVALSPREMKEAQVAAVWVENLEAQTNDIHGLWDELPEEENDSLDQLLAGTAEAPPTWMLKALAAQQEDAPLAPAM